MNGGVTASISTKECASFVQPVGALVGTFVGRDVGGSLGISVGFLVGDFVVTGRLGRSATHSTK